jgi:hypothetical protein
MTLLAYERELLAKKRDRSPRRQPVSADLL